MSTAAFQTEVSAIPGIPEASSIRLSGRVTLDGAPDLRDTILAEVSSTSASRLVLELSHIEQMDTAGAAVLVEALKLAQKRGVRVLFCSPSDSVTQIFRLAGFEEVLNYCCSNPEETRQRLLQ